LKQPLKSPIDSQSFSACALLLSPFGEPQPFFSSSAVESRYDFTPEVPCILSGKHCIDPPALPSPSSLSIDRTPLLKPSGFPPLSRAAGFNFELGYAIKTVSPFSYQKVPVLRKRCCAWRMALPIRSPLYSAKALLSCQRKQHRFFHDIFFFPKSDSFSPHRFSWTAGILFGCDLRPERPPAIGLILFDTLPQRRWPLYPPV